MKCKLDNIIIYYEEYGEGKPVIMLHGYYPDHRLMSGCMEPVFLKREGYRRIYIDLPGMGKTKGEAWIDSSDKMLKVVLGFIDKVIPNERFLIAGESYGGYLARGVMHHMSERVDGLFLLCPSIIEDHSKRDTPPHTAIVIDNELLSTLCKEDAEEFESMAVVQSEEIWERYNKEVYSGVRIANAPFLEKIRNESFSFSFDVDRLKDKYEKPVLFLLGRQDSSVGYKDAWNILDSFPRGTFAVLDRAGHNLQLEQVEVFNTLVDEWIDRVEEILLK
ncbi:MAG: 2-hydroxy-6-oxo-6-phenylhexa-2,4-dienoate hydrolase [Clostridia bacterium BRH_c25]|nr:MAG: 2-hydroxy-6-oxo-6-phenylhexa-2,4-dienoate hydrolase [Clostridia bacterium BRH_c25]